MKSREKMLFAMTNGLKNNFPVVIPYPSIFLRDHWNEITDQPWWVIYNLDPYSRLKVEEDFQKKLDLDWVFCGMCPSRKWREKHKIKIQENHVFLVNILNGEKRELQKESIGGAHIPIGKESVINSMEDVDKYINIVDKETLIQSGIFDYAKMVVEKFGSEKFICAGICTPYWEALKDYFGFKGMMINLYKKTDLIEYALEKIMMKTIEVLKAYAEIGIDGIWIEECLGSANEISLNHFKKFALPYTAEIISEIKRLGMKSIYYACGNVIDRLELIIKSNPDCISLEESKKNFKIDIEWVNKIVAGRVCIFGNLDSIKILQNGTSTELREEIRKQINIGREYGKFVMSLGSPVTPQTPLSRVREYISFARQESYE